MNRGLLTEGLLRFARTLATVLGATAVVSGLLGLADGEALRRSVSVGLYIVGSVLVLGALLVSSRPPVKAAGKGRPGLFSAAADTVRFATAEERRDSIGVAWVLLATGIMVVVVGLLVDGRRPLI